MKSEVQFCVVSGLETRAPIWTGGPVLGVSALTFISEKSRWSGVGVHLGHTLGWLAGLWIRGVPPPSPIPLGSFVEFGEPSSRVDPLLSSLSPMVCAKIPMRD